MRSINKLSKLFPSSISLKKANNNNNTAEKIPSTIKIYFLTKYKLYNSPPIAKSSTTSTTESNPSTVQNFVKCFVNNQQKSTNFSPVLNLLHLPLTSIFYSHNNNNHNSKLTYLMMMNKNIPIYLINIK
jgi:hypothetical protein